MKTDNLEFKGVKTPCYILEETKLRRNLSLIRDVARNADVEFILAFKAFSLWKSFPIFREYINHTTASSLYEARLAYEQFGTKAHIFSPAYTDDSFDAILEYSNHITFNSLSQYERFYPHVASYNQAHPADPISCGLRVNPEFSEIDVEIYNPCAPGSRFGVLSSKLPAQLPEGIEGFHCHNHCDSTSYKLEHSLQKIEQKFAPWLPQLKWLNLGGGHLITRNDYDTAHFIRLINSLHQRYPNLSIILEPGTAFAWNTGELVSTVIDIVENKGIRTAILDVSFTCHMPDCLEMPYQPTVRHAVTLNRDAVLYADPEENVYRLGGNSCLSGDYMSSWQFDRPLKVGDKIIFEDMAHYTTVKTTMFNGVKHPDIAMLHADGEFEYFRRFSYEDYRDRMC